ncbi:uncharacterized protein UHO2_05381 [Ustilago hordei]|uniref:Uncharacterized protein n=1 Tax=Ustilago hordei TaxID=120017 RepID=I2FMK8_USTHO|nr:uncharacterized protein UHO2_05381 [Ustilago hordei]CCF48151.1 uncharacterized protein UHOR_06633 [Ustilago hordei]SYW86757.1 uncharacterized protein UHO2_05381 [Ustilago hordei]
MLSSIDLYHSPTAASSRLAARSPPSASSMKVALPSPRPSSSKIVLAAPTRSTSQVRHSASPSPDSKTEVDSASSRGKGKRLRRAQACDICRKSCPPLACFDLYVFTNLCLFCTVSLSVGGNHRKCNGPMPGSTSCGRCITQHKICTWNFSKERCTRQRCTCVSCKTIGMHIKQSKSAKGAVCKGTSPSASFSSCCGSSETCSPPNTPSDGSHQLRLPLVEYGQTIAQNARVAFTSNPSLQWEQALARKQKPLMPLSQELPHFHFHSECIALANKYNLLIYTLPLTPWDESRPSEATIPSQRGLSCTIPSWIQPAPSRKEAADILRALLEAGSDVESDVGFGVASWTAVPAVLSGSYASDGGGELWDDEEMAQRVRASRSSADDDSDRDSVGESVLAQKGMPIDMDVEENASLEREPESSSAPRGSSHLDCQFPLQHPEQQSMNSGIDPFLLTACHSFSTPPQASPETPWSSIKNSISERNGSCRKKEEDAFWQEGIPAVLQEASNPNALQESLQSLSE